MTFSDLEPFRIAQSFTARRIPASLNHTKELECAIAIHIAYARAGGWVEWGRVFSSSGGGENLNVSLAPPR